jgi:Flp pilus assembly protein TadD
MENYERSAALQPNDAQTYLYMGKALSLLKRTDESVRDLRHALELDGANWEAHYALGGELGMHGQIAEAKAEFQQVVRLRPQFAMGHLNLGVALLKLSDPEGARGQFAETLRLDPSNKSARGYLAAAGKGP